MCWRMGGQHFIETNQTMASMKVGRKIERSHIESGHTLLLEDGEDGGEHPAVEDEEKEEEREGKKEIEEESQRG